MDWLNIHTSTLDSPDFVRCDPIRRATWLMLMRYCIGQENGGVIAGAASWGDTTWQQLARVKLREVKSECSLWSWDGGSLKVAFYPVEKEDEVRARREMARTNGQRGGRPRGTDVGYASETDHKPTSVIFAKAEGEWKGNGMEGEGEQKSAAAPPPSREIDQGDICTPSTPTPAAPITRSWMDWRLTIGRHRVYLDREGNAETAWAELFARAGWDEFTKAWEYCAGKTAKSDGKVFLSNMLEVIS